MSLVWLAFKDVRYRKLRSFLTALGVAIGIAAVVSLISITEGMRVRILGEVRAMGSDTLMILPGTSKTPTSIAQLEEMSRTSVKVGVLTEKDLREVEKVDEVEVASPQLGMSFFSLLRGAMKGKAKVVYRREVRYLPVLGVVPSKQVKVENAEVVEGRYLSDNDKYAAVLGWKIAKEAFGEDVKVGKKIEINGKDFTVVGVLEETGQRLELTDYTVYIPMDAARQIFANEFKEDEISLIVVKIKENEDVQEVANKIEEILMKSRDIKTEEEKDFTVLTPQYTAKVVNNIILVLDIFLGSIAAISLIVAGVGIMNTMFTTVREKVREIGIMKAIGARNRQILVLFLWEAVIIGLLGGILGLGMSIVLSQGISHIGTTFSGRPLLVVITPQLVIGASLFSALIGILSGIVPAYKASKLEPAVALRYE